MGYRRLLIIALLLLFLWPSPVRAAGPSGDADGSGRLDPADALLSLQSLAGLRPAAGSLRAAISILQVLAGLDPDFTPPGAPVLNLPSDLDVGCNYATLLCYAKLSWQAPTDDRGVAGYLVYRDAVLVGETAQLNFTGTFVVNQQAVATYLFQVRAFDAAGNLSAGSNLLGITAPSSPGPVVVSGNVAQ